LQAQNAGRKVPENGWGPAMDRTADPDAYWSPVRVGVISGVMALHAALLLALTLPVAAPIKRGVEFFVPYECTGLGLCTVPPYRGPRYYRYSAQGMKIAAVVAEPMTIDGRADVVPDIAAKGDRLSAPVVAYAKTFDSRPRAVELRILVSETGRPLDVQVVRGSGDALLDQNAADYAQERWRFKPALDRGRKVRSSVRVTMEFDFLGQSENAVRYEPWFDHPIP
jgi:TonB family protein